jgi:phage recombination protein Bet
MTQQQRPTNALAKISEFVGGRFSPQEVAVIREVVASQGQGGALNDAELAVFLKQAARAKLDPFSKQIYAIRRGGRMTIQVGIDGLRAIAERTGTYAGSDDYKFGGDPKAARPETATCTVYRIVNGQRVPTTRTVWWVEFGSDQGQWKKMPRQMLGKVAEAHALRAAFPNDCSGLFTDDEMAQADRAAAPRDAQDVDYTVRAGDADMRVVEAQAELEGREVDIDEPEFEPAPKPGAPGGAP